jgi:hypothetical protein
VKLLLLLSLLLLFTLQMGFCPVADTTHNTQTKHSTGNYTNNKGHTTHNEYNESTITATTNTITTTKKTKLHGLSPQANYTDRLSDRRLSACQL